MVKLTQKIAKFFLKTLIGFCLVMFISTEFAMSKSSQQVISHANLELPLPNSLIIGVALLMVSLHLISALLLTGLNFLKMGQGQLSLDTLIIAIVVSAVGVVIALVSFQLNSLLLNSIALAAIIINSTTFVANLLGAFIDE